MNGHVVLRNYKQRWISEVCKINGKIYKGELPVPLFLHLTGRWREKTRVASDFMFCKYSGLMGSEKSVKIASKLKKSSRTPKSQRTLDYWFPVKLRKL